MRKHHAFFSFFVWVLIFSLFQIQTACSQSPPRGMFVSVIQSPATLENLSAIREMIRFSKKSGIQTLFVQVYRGGKTWFPSRLGDDTPYENALHQTGEDPFAYLIRAAHAEGIQVHAWMNMLSLSDNADAPILKRHGLEILTRNESEKKEVTDYLIDSQYWLEPGDPRVRQELSELVVEVVTAYPALDGIQLDYIRYPDTKPAYGYTSVNLQRYAAATGREHPHEKDEAWRKWKRDQVTEVVQILKATARAINPKIQFSTTGCVSYVRAREEAFQDWAVWLNEGLADFVTMMSYPPDVTTLEKYLKEARAKVNDFSKISIGIGAYKLVQKPDIFKVQWQVCEAAGGRSCVVFHYGDLLLYPKLKRPLRQGYIFVALVDFLKIKSLN